MASFLLRPNGRGFIEGDLSQCRAPYGRLHWATVVAHSVRCRSAAFINYPHGEQSELKKSFPF